jgi:hypothetical protein
MNARIAPLRGILYIVGGNYLVCAEPGEFTSTHVTAMTQGAEYWAAALRDKGYEITFDIQVRDETDSACDMTIVADPVVNPGAVAEALGTSNGH